MSLGMDEGPYVPWPPASQADEAGMRRAVPSTPDRLVACHTSTVLRQTRRFVMVSRSFAD